MAQDMFKMKTSASANWTTVYQPDENMGAAWETMFTEDSGRIQSGVDVSTPMFTVEQYSYHASYIPVSEATTIIQMIAGGNPVYIHYFSLYYGQWRDAQFRVGKSDSITIGRLVEGEEYYEELSFNMTGVEPIGSGGGGGGGGQSFAVSDTISAMSQSTSVTTSGISVTIPEDGTWRFTFPVARTATSGTWTVQLYKGNTAISGASVTWSSGSYKGSFDGNITGLHQGDVISIRYRSGGTSYRVFAGQLVARKVT